MIELKNVTKTFTKKGSVVTALAGLSLRVEEGQIFGIIGSSGAGKSTLIRCVNLLERPASGEVIVDGQQLLQLSPRDLALARTRIGMIFQHFNLLASATVEQNIALPLELQKKPRAFIEKRVADLLNLVGLGDKAGQYPANLSGGQKQRVAIARALSTEPRVLLCDEATSALDPATTRSILDLIKEISRRLRITVLLITHEMEVIRSICDKVAVLDEGKLVEQGSVSAVFARPSSEITRRFLRSSLNVEMPADYAARLQPGPDGSLSPLLRLEISGSSLDSPVLSEAARKFGVDNHIVSGRIDSAAGVTFGILIVEVRGAGATAAETLQFFQSRNIKADLLGYV